MNPDPNVKLCECGCGTPTTVYNGTPRRFRSGHNKSALGRQTVFVDPPNPSGKCMCGCGEDAPLAPKTSTHWGNMKGYPMRFIRGHRPRIQEKMEWSSNLWREEDRGFTSPCHVWLGARDKLGYGRFRGAGLAHRFSWQEKKGPIPEGLSLDHLCRITSCINPDHLEPVTHRENLLRGNGTKINFTIAEQMRAMYGGGRGKGMTQRQIADHFGVEKRLVWKVTSGRAWTHDPTLRA